MKNKIVELYFYNDSEFPEYHIYHLPKELTSFLSWINTCSEKGWKIEVKETSVDKMLNSWKG